MTISPEERSYRRLAKEVGAKVGARKKNPTDSVRATVIIPKKEYDILPLSIQFLHHSNHLKAPLLKI